MSYHQQLKARLILKSYRPLEIQKQLLMFFHGFISSRAVIDKDWFFPAAAGVHPRE